MQALKQTFGLLLAFLFLLEGTGCAMAKKSHGKQKGWVYSPSHSNHNGSKLKTKI